MRSLHETRIKHEQSNRSKNDNYPQPTSNNNYSNNNNATQHHNNQVVATNNLHNTQPNSYSNYKNLFDVSNSDTTDDEKLKLKVIWNRQSDRCNQLLWQQQLTTQ